MTPNLDTLSTAPTVFTVFYAIFWGLVANAQIRWKAFDWPLALAGRKRHVQYRPSWKRLRQSLFYLTILPTVLFVALLMLLTLAKPPKGLCSFVVALVVAIVSAHAGFAPYRLWLASIEAEPDSFYYPVKCKPGYYTAQPEGLEPFPLQRLWARSNYCVAWSYVVIAFLFALAGVGLSYVPWEALCAYLGHCLFPPTQD